MLFRISSSELVSKFSEGFSVGWRDHCVVGVLVEDYHSDFPLARCWMFCGRLDRPFPLHRADPPAAISLSVAVFTSWAYGLSRRRFQYIISMSGLVSVAEILTGGFRRCQS